MDWILCRLSTKYDWILNTRNFLVFFRMCREWKEVQMENVKDYWWRLSYARFHHEFFFNYYFYMYFVARIIFTKMFQIFC